MFSVTPHALRCIPNTRGIFLSAKDFLLPSAAGCSYCIIFVPCITSEKSSKLASQFYSRPCQVTPNPKDQKPFLYISNLFHDIFSITPWQLKKYQVVHTIPSLPLRQTPSFLMYVSLALGSVRFSSKHCFVKKRISPRGLLFLSLYFSSLHYVVVLNTQQSLA